MSASAQGLPQNEAISSAKAVVKGDVLETSTDFLESAPMMIEWSQKWITRKEKYYFVVFENTSQGTYLSLLGDYLMGFSAYSVSRRR